MLTGINHPRTLAIVAALMLLIAPSTGRAYEDPAVEEGNCAFSKQLQDEYEKIQFVNELRVAKEASQSPYGESLANSVQAKMSNGETMEIDRFSVDCLSCHDGIYAKGKDIRYKNNSEHRMTDMSSVRGSHPIGMHYGSYAYADRSFKPLHLLKKGMELIDGKVGCLTCHNPFNKKKYHLVMENDQSKLCFSCHTK